MMQSIPTVLTTLTKIQWNERNVCIANSYITYFMVSYSTMGGLGIAVYRVLYVKVKYISQNQTKIPRPQMLIPRLKIDWKETGIFPLS